ncbi:MAG: hypothetical protein IT372_06275, partial [Polyangiaceae bacterium]|nr:hypothetical protein [Polyangiaceae bacterium]
MQESSAGRLAFVAVFDVQSPGAFPYWHGGKALALRFGDARSHACACLDGRLLIGYRGGRPGAPEGRELCLFRLDGDKPDPAFGDQGLLPRRLPYAGVADVEPIAAMGVPSGFFVVGNAVIKGAERAFVARFGHDGSFSSSFGAGGCVLLPARGRARAMSLDGGSVTVAFSQTGQDGELEIHRYRESGQLDAGYGQGGVARLKVPAGFDMALHATGMTPRKDGLVIHGTARGPGGAAPFVARLSLNGAADASFGVEGVRIAEVPDVAMDMAAGYLDEDIPGKVKVTLVGGTDFGGVAATRFTGDKLDKSFSGDGHYVGALPGFSRAALHCMRDLSIVAGSAARDGTGALIWGFADSISGFLLRG